MPLQLLPRTGASVNGSHLHHFQTPCMDITVRIKEGRGHLLATWSRGLRSPWVGVPGGTQAFSVQATLGSLRLWGPRDDSTCPLCLAGPFQN